MLENIKEVCDLFQRDVDNLEPKCAICQSAIDSHMREINFNPITGEMGLICDTCSAAESRMVQEITGPITMGEIFHLDPGVRMQTNMKIEEARRQVRVKMLEELKP